MFWSGWSELLRLIVVGSLAYLGLVLLLRSAGKQALTKMNAYGLVVTVALGSALATALLSSQVTLDKALVAFALLLSLQRLFAWLSTRYIWFRRLVNNEPTLLLRDGEMLPCAMRKANVTEDELTAAVRSAGHGELSEVAAIILETDGGFSVLPRPRPH